MRFNPKARIDTSRTSDAGRGGGGGGLGRGGGGLSIPGGAIGGGGIGSVVIVIIFVLVTQVLGGGGDTTATDGSGAATGQDTDRYAACNDGADANANTDCAVPIVENSLRSYWSRVLPEQTGTAFEPASLRTFTDSIGTGGCGQASSAVGPFYCPGDRVIYLDTTFFAQVLEGQLGGQGGDFVEPYVLGHEYGHHIQNLLGTMGQVRTQKGPNSDAVRLELQADCYAGMWTKGALGTADDSGEKIFESLDAADVDEALDAAKTVGDDLIQKKTSGRVDPEGWTHGSSAQRQRWFRTGYAAADMSACDTFAATDL